MRKIVYSLVAAPLAVTTLRAHFWQRRRKAEKEQEIADRQSRLHLPPLDLPTELSNPHLFSSLFQSRHYEFRPV